VQQNLNVRFIVVLQELFQQLPNIQLSTSADSAKISTEPEDDREMSKLPRPDVTQMLPFKPKRIVRKFSHFCNLFMVPKCKCFSSWDIK